MKNITTLLIALLISLSTFAQQGINYKAIVKDDTGNVLSSVPLSVRFTIYKEDPDVPANNVYQESHTINTDVNGLVILNIGSEAVGDSFTSINWEDSAHWLEVEINTGTGFVPMGDPTAFNSVPYALHAESANLKTVNNVTSNTPGDTTLDSFVFGSSQMDNDPSTPDDDSRMYFNKTKSAFRAGLIQGTLGNDAQLGMYSTAFGRNNQAISANSVALGENNSAIGLNATAIGYSNDANGSYSLALGADTEANGYYSTAMNWTTTADAYASTAIGRYNIGGGTIDDWIETDALFEIGNSQDPSNKTNALTVLKNGTITAPSLSIAEINSAGDKALVTKEYFDTNGPSGLEIVNGTTGLRIVGRNPGSYGSIGSSSVAIGISSIASGNNSTAMGYNTTASSTYSIAMGASTIASNDYSTAMGSNATASGKFSTAMGGATIAPSYAETAIGFWNTVYAPISINNWDLSDRLFVVGNGTGALRSDAFIILKNGTITAPSLTNTLINTAGNKALITKEYADGNYLAASGDVAIDGSLNIYNATDSASSWRFTTVSAGHLSIYRNGAYRGYFHEATGAYTQGSDKRLKKDITSLTNGTLDKVMQLNPVSYLMKDQTDNKRNLGLISQEVQELFPSITHYVEEQDLLALSYTELIPILIKALQEQQTIIDGQNTKIGIQDSKIEAQASETISQNRTIASLLQRMEKLEANN